MSPKRKKGFTAAASKKAKKEPEAEPKLEAPPALGSKSKPIERQSASEVWTSAEYVSEGKMTQEGFATLIGAIGIEEMSFEAIYLSFRLSPSEQTVEDVMTVCASKHSLQSAMDGLGCQSMGELPGKLRSKSAALQSDFGAQFSPFFRWLFEMGKAISALNNGVSALQVRTVPLAEGLQLMEAVLGAWPLMTKLKAFCLDKYSQPFSRDLWTQIGRFVNMTSTGQIRADLSNYDDDAAGGSAWPCAVDEFVEYVKEAA